MAKNASEPPKVEFFFDCGSPWTYIAFENIQRMLWEQKFNLVMRPILIGGIFDTVNGSVYHSRANPVPAKDAYTIKDIQDWARTIDLKIQFPPKIFPLKSVKAMRACIVAGTSGQMPALARALFSAYWSHGEDIADPDILKAVCDKAGLDGTEMLKAIDHPDIKNSLRNNTEELIKRGGFGSPTIFIDDSDMYFGNDRLSLVRLAVEQKLALSS